MDTLIILTAEYLYLFVILIAAVYISTLNKVGKIQIAKLSLFTLPLAYIVSKILELFIYDPRPFVVEHIKPLIAHAADNGFPSDHTLLTMTIASIIFVYNRKLGVILAGLAIAIGAARVFAGVHHPFDIIGSIAIAIGATIISQLTLMYLYKH